MGDDTRPLSVLDSEQHPGCWDDSASSPAFPRICASSSKMTEFRVLRQTIACSFVLVLPAYLYLFIYFTSYRFLMIVTYLWEDFPSIIGTGGKKILRAKTLVFLEKGFVSEKRGKEKITWRK